MAGRQSDSEQRREANVLLELRMAGSMSEELLDAYSDDVMEALAKSAGDVALGPAIALNLGTSTIKVRFDVLGDDDAELHGQVSEVLKVIERDTHLVLARGTIAA